MVKVVSMDEQRDFMDVLVELLSIFRQIEPNLYYVIGNLEQIRDGRGEMALLDVNGCIEMLKDTLEWVQKQYKLESDYIQFYGRKLKNIKKIIEKPAPKRRTL